MRKAILTIVMAFAYIISMHAVPSGIYVDSKDRARVVINRSDINILRTNGEVLLNGTIVSENEDHSFTIQFTTTGRTEAKNAWFVDQKGRICLNIEGLPETCTKKEY